MNQTALILGNKQPSPRERYLAEQAEINKANAKANAVNDEGDDKIIADSEAIEKDLDKSLGDTKVSNVQSEKTTTTMTREDYLRHKGNREAKKVIQAMQRQQVQHLTEAEAENLKAVLEDFDHGRVDDQVMKHLITQKVKNAQDFVKNQVETKQLQEEMLKQVTLASEKALKIRGVMESIDRQILERDDELDGSETAGPADEGSKG